MTCPVCERELLMDRTVADDDSLLPPFVPRTMVKLFPATVFQWACPHRACNYEQCIVRGPNGTWQWGRTWERGKEAEAAAP